MPDYPDDFVPDLQRLKSWPSLEGSLWRKPHLVRATYGEVARVVCGLVPREAVRLLDAGCGTGFLSLELARRGHQVVAVDPDEESISLAKRAALPPNLAYHVADLATWDDESDSYDVVILSRVLHHLPEPEMALQHLSGLLRPGGALVCLEFAYDLFDRRSASWLAQMGGLLEAAGMKEADQSLHSVEGILDEWWREHEEEDDLNTYEQMHRPLAELFREAHFGRHAYLYWDLLEAVRGPSDDVEAAVAGFLPRAEQELVEAGDLPSVMFSFVGRH